MLDRLETERRESGFRALVAEEAERRRVAAELHDEIGQRLTALLLQIDRLVARRAARARATSSRARSTATKETLEGVRGLARRLRPEVLDELGLVPALRNLCDRIEEGTGVVVRRSLDPELPALSPDAELVDLSRRPGGADQRRPPRQDHTRRDVTLAARDGEVELVVHDDGVGVGEHTAEDSAGGIRGMRERALLIGARLEVVPAERRGTDVRLHVPVPR